jgi:hypothetical protein
MFPGLRLSEKMKQHHGFMKRNRTEDPTRVRGRVRAARGSAAAARLQLRPLIRKHMSRAGRISPARLQSALALVEKLRDNPSLTIGDHLVEPSTSGLALHVTYGDRAHRRLNLQPVLAGHGRISSRIAEWGQEFLDGLAKSGFLGANRDAQAEIIDAAQAALARPLRHLVEDPITARLSNSTAEAVLADILSAAEQKGKNGEVAQYLVGAKLALRFNGPTSVYPAGKSDRTSRPDAVHRFGDLEIGNAVIRVALGLPDDKHLLQIAEIQDKSDAEVWLLTRADRVETWQRELSNTETVEIERVIVASVEKFVGQNITELGQFSARGKAEQLRALFDLYNTRWVAKVGTRGIRIVAQ